MYKFVAHICRSVISLVCNVDKYVITYKWGYM